ncbi:hypothetical protein [Streptomyces collinus]|uniref:hypothetical protein n=1 Tax=Streptomyces collinus TaxID=42684 RepID=UPI0036E8F62B
MTTRQRNTSSNTDPPVRREVVLGVDTHGEMHVAAVGDGPVHSARIYKLAKDSAVKARTQAINQLKAVLVIADPALREQCRAWAMPSCSAPARPSARPMVGETGTRWPRPPT